MNDWIIWRKPQGRSLNRNELEFIVNPIYLRKSAVGLSGTQIIVSFNICKYIT